MEYFYIVELYIYVNSSYTTPSIKIIKVNKSTIKD